MDHSTMEKLLNVDEKSIATTAAIDWLKLNFENKQTNFIINKKTTKTKNLIFLFLSFRITIRININCRFFAHQSLEGKQFAYHILMSKTGLSNGLININYPKDAALM